LSIVTLAKILYFSDLLAGIKIRMKKRKKKRKKKEDP
jgi:hypothetical protein